MNRWRAALYVDALLAAIPAVIAVATPQRYAELYFHAQPTEESLVFIRELGTTFAAYAAMIIFGLRRGNADFWRVYLPVAVFADVFYLATFLHGITLASAWWSVSAIGNIVYNLAFVPIKCLVAVRPSRVSVEGAERAG